MTLAEGKELIELILDKEFEGGRVTPEYYNTLLEEVYMAFFKSKIELYMNQADNTTNQPYLSSKLLREFYMTQSITPTAGVYALAGLSNTYAYWIGAFVTYNSSQKEIELVEGNEVQNRLSNRMTKDPAKYPIATIKNASIYFYPKNLTSITLDYFKKPAQPIYDYYIDVNGRIQPLAASATHAWVTGEKDSTGTTRTAGQPDWTSLTVELEFNEDLHMEFFNEILKRMGVHVEDTLAIQYANQLKAEENQI